MPHKDNIIPDEYLQELNVNGLNGRLLHLPAQKKKTHQRELLFVYGHHSSLERIYGFAEDLAQYGNVTVPDLPGFGGMDSLYNIDELPDLDTLADYLAAVIKLRFKNKRFSLAGFSFGFLVVTRMLQKYPAIASRIDEVISVAGFTHYDDFKLSKKYVRLYQTLLKVFSAKATAWMFRYVVLNNVVLKTFYASTPNAKHKFQHLDREEFKRMIRFDIELWHNNDVRTYMFTGRTMFAVDLTKIQVKKPVLHIRVSSDQYFDQHITEQHMRCIYKDFKEFVAVMPAHMPSVLATKEESAPFIPKGIRNILSNAPGR